MLRTTPLARGELYFVSVADQVLLLWRSPAQRGGWSFVIITDSQDPPGTSCHPAPGPAELLNSVGGSRRGTWTATEKNMCANGALFIYLDSGVKPQNDTYENIRDTNLNNIRKRQNYIQPLSSCGLTPGSRSYKCCAPMARVIALFIATERSEDGYSL